MLKEEVMLEIDRVIKEIWEKDIKEDYNRNYILREDSLKCSIYFHMRKKLDKLLRVNGLRIYSEFYIKDLKYRADIVIAQVDAELEKRDLRDCVTDIPFIIEIKLKGSYSKDTIEVIKKDIAKAKSYLKRAECQCYLAIIYEDECSWLYWMDKRATNNWARGSVTELNAGYLDGVMTFETNSYNGLN